MEEAATPFPREETTPPVTKIYLGFILAGGIPRTAGMRRAEPPWEWQYEILWTELFPVSNAVWGGSKMNSFASRRVIESRQRIAQPFARPGVLT